MHIGLSEKYRKEDVEYDISTLTRIFNGKNIMCFILKWDNLLDKNSNYRKIFISQINHVFR